MSSKIQALIALIVVIGFIYVINLVRKNKLDLKYALSWLTVAILILVLDFVPNLMESLSKFLGIADPVNMIFLFGFGFSLIIILTLTVGLSITSQSVKRLNQKIGMLDKELREIKEHIERK